MSRYSEQGPAAFSRQTCVLDSITIKWRRVGSARTPGKWKTCRDEHGTKSKLGTVFAFYRPLRLHSVGFMLGSRRARLVEQSGWIAAFQVAERRQKARGSSSRLQRLNPRCLPTYF